MAISKKDVEYLGLLARIQLSSEELDRFAGQLQEILEHVEKLKRAGVSQVPETSHALKGSQVTRKDKTTPCLSTDQTLANAPEKEGPFFKVPRVIDTS